VRITRVLHYVWRPLALIAGVYSFSVTGFILTQKVSVFTGVYWGVITMSTVGYGDVVPTNDLSKVFAIILAASTIGILGYVISSINTLALKAREEEALGLDGTKFSDHTLILGWTPVSLAALQELILAGRRVAVMTRRQESLPEIRTFIANFLRLARKNPKLKGRLSREEDLFVAYGDYSERGSLDLLNVASAREAIVASDDDARNVLTALILKELAPHLRIVVAVLREQLRETLRAAGVTYVISPSDLGGRMVSAAAVQPEVAQAIDDVTTTAYGSTIDEYLLGPDNPLTGQTFSEATQKLMAATGTLLIGVASPAGTPDPGSGDEYRVKLNPPVDTRLSPGGYVLVLSSLDNLDRLRAWIRTPPGRRRAP
jgi:voltage-gated potassium channel